MLLAKRTGGATQTYRLTGKTYAWKKDDSVTEVPDEFAADLLAIRGGDYYVPEEVPAEVTEPAPAAKAPVTEPAPKSAAAVLTEGKPATTAKAAPAAK